MRGRGLETVSDVERDRHIREREQNVLLETSRDRHRGRKIDSGTDFLTSRPTEIEIVAFADRIQDGLNHIETDRNRH